MIFNLLIKFIISIGFSQSMFGACEEQEFVNAEDNCREFSSPVPRLHQSVQASMPAIQMRLLMKIKEKALEKLGQSLNQTWSYYQCYNDFVELKAILSEDCFDKIALVESYSSNSQIAHIMHMMGTLNESGISLEDLENYNKTIGEMKARPPLVKGEPSPRPMPKPVVEKFVLPIVKDHLDEWLKNNYKVSWSDTGVDLSEVNRRNIRQTPTVFCHEHREDSICRPYFERLDYNMAVIFPKVVSEVQDRYRTVSALEFSKAPYTTFLAAPVLNLDSFVNLGIKDEVVQRLGISNAQISDETLLHLLQVSATYSLEGKSDADLINAFRAASPIFEDIDKFLKIVPSGKMEILRKILTIGKESDLKDLFNRRNNLDALKKTFDQGNNLFKRITSMNPPHLKSMLMLMGYDEIIEEILEQNPLFCPAANQLKERFFEETLPASPDFLEIGVAVGSCFLLKTAGCLSVNGLLSGLDRDEKSHKAKSTRDAIHSVEASPLAPIYADSYQLVEEDKFDPSSLLLTMAAGKIPQGVFPKKAEELLKSVKMGTKNFFKEIGEKGIHRAIIRDRTPDDFKWLKKLYPFGKVTTVPFNTYLFLEVIPPPEEKIIEGILNLRHLTNEYLDEKEAQNSLLSKFKLHRLNKDLSVEDIFKGTRTGLKTYRRDILQRLDDSDQLEKYSPVVVDYVHNLRKVFMKDDGYVELPDKMSKSVIFLYFDLFGYLDSLGPGVSEEKTNQLIYNQHLFLANFEVLAGLESFEGVQAPTELVKALGEPQVKSLLKERISIEEKSCLVGNYLANIFYQRKNKIMGIENVKDLKDFLARPCTEIRSIYTD